MSKVNWSRLEEGLNKYQSIMEFYEQSERISTSDEFKKKYRNFYGMNRGKIPDEFYREYFDLLDLAKMKKDLDFNLVLQRLYVTSGKKHVSFTSKLLASANPNLPVWDSKVRRYLKFKFDLKFKNSFKDIESCEQEYMRYCSWFKDFLKKDEATKLIEEFDKKIPNVKITKMKKIDLMFWQMEY
jgi:hypothetical protein